MSGPTTSKIITAIAIAGVAVPGIAQEQQADAEQSEESIDEITVMGARSLAVMRAQVAQAEEVVFDTFNELNDDDEYDIICKKETRIGSQIPKRICLARMYRDELAEMTIDENNDTSLVVGTMTNSQKHQKILIDKMRALAKEHPELQDALYERYRLEAEYEAERKKRYGE